MQDLESNILLEILKTFAEDMRIIRKQVGNSEKLSYKYQKERIFLDAVDIYYRTVEQLLYELQHANIKSEGLISFREYLSEYIQSDRFILLANTTKKNISDLSSIKYCIHYRGLGFMSGILNQR